MKRIRWEPLELKRSWVWRPRETAKPYNCVEAKRPSARQ